MPNRSHTNQWTTLLLSLSKGPVGQANASLSRQLLHRRAQLRLLRLAKGGGEPPDCSKIKALGPPSQKAAAHRPMVWGSLSSASAVAEAVQPWASSQIACHLSRSRGVGARIVRRCKSLILICHCSRNRSISLTPIINPSQLPKPTNSVPSQIYPMRLRISPWLWFRTKDCWVLSRW